MSAPDPAVFAALSHMIATEDRSAFHASYAEWVEAAGLPGAVVWLCDSDSSTIYPALGFTATLPADRPIPDNIEACAAGDIPLVADDLLVGMLTVTVDQLALAEPCADLLAAAVLAQGRMEVAQRETTLLRGQITGLTAAGQLLRHLDLETLLVNVLETAMQGVGAQVGALLTADEAGTLTSRVTWGMREEHVHAIRLKDGSSLAEQVLRSGTAQMVPADRIAAELNTTGLEAALTSLLVLPLGVGERRRGVILLANPAVDFGVGQQRVAETVCSMAAIAIDNALLVRAAVDQQRLQSEMDLARQVQMGMYPTEGLQLGPVAVAGLARPCTETGGDYYTFVERDGRLLAMIGDVSGHGLGAALYTTTAHAVLHQQLRAEAGAGSAIRVLNESLHSTSSGRFMTAAIVDIDPVSLSFHYHSAGHNPLLWLHKGEVRWLESTAMPLGIVASNPSEEVPAQTFAPGDRLILYTDGITEAADLRGELFGETRLAKVAQGLAHEDADTMIKGLMRAMDAFTTGAPIKDDVTLVVLTIASA